VRERYGKADLVASILGMLAAIGNEVETVGVVAAMVVLFVSFLVGGIAAGRMSRYDGGINGMGTALWFLLLVGKVDAALVDEARR